MPKMPSTFYQKIIHFFNLSDPDYVSFVRSYEAKTKK